jgi:hypothetical protein
MAKLTKDHNLAKANPKLAKEWHPRKNGKLKPTDITPGSSRSVWWVCENGHEWKAMVYERNRGSGCPSCLGRTRVDSRKLARHGNPRSRCGSPLTSSVRKVGVTSTGSVLVEMPRKEWERLCSLTLPPDDLGAAIVQYRTRQGLSQGAFAEMAGLHRNWVSAIERDRAVRMSFETYKSVIAVISG